MAEQINLIYLESPDATIPVDRGGGETHGMIKGVVKRVTRAIPYEDFATELEKVMGQVQAAARSLRAEVEGYEADEISIGLAVSGEGDIGVATAGVEASIEVTFKRKQ